MQGHQVSPWVSSLSERSAEGSTPAGAQLMHRLDEGDRTLDGSLGEYPVAEVEYVPPRILCPFEYVSSPVLYQRLIAEEEAGVKVALNDRVPPESLYCL